MVDSRGEGCHKLKMEFYKALLASETPEAATSYRLDKQCTATDAKTQMWEEFGEAIEKDFQLALKKFWQTIRQFRRGKQHFVQYCIKWGQGAADRH